MRKYHLEEQSLERFSGISFVVKSQLNIDIYQLKLRCLKEI